jgi:hypothetical protein
MNEIIQEIFKKYGEFPSGQFPHIEWLKGRLLELDEEIEQIQQDHNRLLSELCKARNTINRLQAGGPKKGRPGHQTAARPWEEESHRPGSVTRVGSKNTA